MGKNADMNDVVLKVEHLTKHYPIKKGVFSKSDACVHALEDASFEVHRGETFAIVGESGCGKSTTGKCILRLTEPTSGEVILDGEDFTKLKGEDLTRARQKMKLIFQDPYSSLNPRMTVADIIAEPIDIAGTYKTRAERDARVEEIMQAVGLDLSVQAKVINLLEELQDKLGLSYIFISHDLSVVKHISDTVMVMYLGHTMELASKQELFDDPLHPYTKALLDVIPRIRHERIQDKKILQGDVPSPTNPPAGCVFHTRCQHCMKVCCERAPEMREVKPGHKCACHLFDEGLTEEEKTPVSI